MWLLSLFISFVLSLFVQHVQALQGDSVCGQYMCVLAFLNGTEWTYQMRANLGENGFGWMAIGFGSTMTSSPMVIMWPNRDGSVTLSQRAATGHTEPKVVQNPPRTATKYLQLSSQTSSETNLAFTIPPNGQPQRDTIVWAIGTTRPSSGAVDATLMQHIASGAFQIDLSRTFSDNTNGTAAPTGTSGPNYAPPWATQHSGSDLPQFRLPALLPYQKMLMAHAILSGIGFLVILPTGILVARWGRLVTDSWFKIHWTFQAVLAIPVIASGWFLAVAGIIKKEGRHFDDTHKVVGLVLIGAYALQLLLGIHIHIFKPKGGRQPRPIPLSAVGKRSNVFQLIVTSGRPLQNYSHAILGLAIIALSFYQVYRGIKYEWEISTGRGPSPDVVQKLWIAWIVLLPTAYLFGLALLPKQLTKERKNAQTRMSNSDGLPLKSPPPASKKSVKTAQISKPVPFQDDEEWKREEDAEQARGDVMSEDSHAPHSMQPVQYARQF